jgi:cytochrome P450
MDKTSPTRISDPDPYPNFRWLREHDPVSLTSERESSRTYVVTPYRHVRAALVDARLNPDGIEPDAQLIGADPQDHARLRQVMSALLPNNLVQRFQPRISDICNAAIDAFAERGSAELMDEFAVQVPVAVIHELVGLPAELQEPPQACMEHFFRASFAVRRDPDSMAFIDAYLRRIVDFKRRNPGADMTTALLAALDRGELKNERELRTVLYSIIGGGHVSTGPFIAAAVLRLLENPDQLADARADPELWPAVVEEALRYDSAVQYARNRYADCPLTIGDAEVGEHDIVMLSLAAANRDPSAFPDPDRFDIHRAKTPHLAFSHGIHYCPGSQLARAEGVIALRALFDRIPDLHLADPGSPVTWTLGPALRGPVAIRVRFTPQRLASAGSTPSGNRPGGH